MGNVVLALDLATELGWAVGPVDGEPRFGHHVLPKTGDDVGHFALAYDRWLRDVLIKTSPAVVVFEAPMPDTAGRTPLATSLKLKGLCWHTEFMCAKAGIRVVQESASSWKKSICGTGRISKAMRPYPVFVALEQRGFKVYNHNAADALALWIHAVGALSPRNATRFDPLFREVRA